MPATETTATDPTTQRVPLERFGKDHWSLLAYAETRAVDQDGLDRRHLRCNAERHPHLTSVYHRNEWKPEWGTRLKGYFAAEDKSQHQLPEHDDWDCLEDLEAAGLLEILSLINGFVRITPEGRRVVNELRQHKHDGGNFANFTPSQPPRAA